jgi:hypothetical protein
MVISGFGIDMGYGLAALMLEVDAAGSVYSGRDGTGLWNEAAASAAALGLRLRKVHCVAAERGWSSCYGLCIATY